MSSPVSIIDYGGFIGGMGIRTYSIRESLHGIWHGGGAGMLLSQLIHRTSLRACTDSGVET